jgi:uncharacterized protein YdeI (YjbR/CyaY-like superfamily)
MPAKEIASFYPKNQAEWRQWLLENHLKEEAVWLICYKKSSNIPSISWSDAVDEALCFGWIDSVRKTIDEEKFIQFFSKRKKNGTWSSINKEKVVQLTQQGKMTSAGLECITIAKQNGSWNILDTVEALLIPADLEEQFEHNSTAKSYYMSLSKSVQKAILQWLVLAKRPETRQKRIAEIIEQANQDQKPRHL